MSTIKTIQELRNKVLQAFMDLEDGKIDISQASTLAKLSETIISGLKSEMQYSILTNQKPEIPFFNQKSGIALEKTEFKKLI
jgi:hypothetical protein